MAPKHQRIAISKAETHRTSPNYLVAGYQAIVSPNNANIVRSVAMFGVAVAFISSSWSDFLLPP
ncbi:component of translocase of the outer mitochondrial membrane complex [Golovinomyces cichoracearum]|uniref:Component of translocase of the outer mitochondrial membrane complex n=1 Tax=Golovinomyces cichoracearum TaxID=62708 RepID=A0A420J6Z9_9PEZI|nr:component of translocase of the outer mitochondrial membrane complex [Golovinomyces cichoracearum]